MAITTAAELARQEACRQSNIERAHLGLPPLMTLKEFDTLAPEQQGYISYMQAAWPGSELPEHCPYPAGSRASGDWARGALRGTIEAQDSEE